MLYACGPAICYDNICNADIIHFQFMLFKNVMVRYAITIKKNLILVTHYHSFYCKHLYIFSIAAYNVNQQYDANACIQISTTHNIHILYCQGMSLINTCVLTDIKAFRSIWDKLAYQYMLWSK